MQLLENPRGGYRFLTGIAPYSSGAIALPGFEVVRVTLRQPLPYVAGFDLIDRHLAAVGRPRQALCGIELRSPTPFTFDGFAAFNTGYRELLASWDLLVGDQNPVARTNIAPEVDPPTTESLYAFSYTAPSLSAAQTDTFVVAGAGDLRPGPMGPEGIVRAGETSTQALQEKATFVMQTMEQRLAGLQAGWAHVTAVDLYTVFPLQPLLVRMLLTRMHSAASHGLHWFYGHPPIQGLHFEMDLRGVGQELRV